MKKTLSIILSLVMLITSLSFSVNAFAATKAKAPERTLGESFSVTLPGVAIDDEKAAKNAYIGKFTPAKKGYYEVVFDTPYAPAVDPKVDASFSMAIASIVDENDGIIGIGMASSADGKVDEKDAYPSFAGELKAGKTYYIVAANYAYGDYTSNVVINEHTHHLYQDIFPSTVNKNLKENENGMYYTACDNTSCMYYKINKSIPRVKSITVSRTKYTYDGKEKKPKVSIKDSKGNELDKKNYKIAYSNNKKVGTAKLKIKFKNEYEGTYTVKYKINPAKTSVKSVSAKSRGFKVKIKKQDVQTSGYQIQYATDKGYSKNKKTVTVKGNKNTAKEIKGLRARQKYFVRVRTYKTVDGKKYYSGWSKSQKITTKR